MCVRAWPRALHSHIRTVERIRTSECICTTTQTNERIHTATLAPRSTFVMAQNICTAAARYGNWSVMFFVLLQRTPTITTNIDGKLRQMSMHAYWEWTVGGDWFGGSHTCHHAWWAKRRVWGRGGAVCAWVEKLCVCDCVCLCGVWIIICCMSLHVGVRCSLLYCVATLCSVLQHWVNWHDGLAINDWHDGPGLLAIMSTQMNAATGLGNSECQALFHSRLSPRVDACLWVREGTRRIKRASERENQSAHMVDGNRRRGFGAGICRRLPTFSLCLAASRWQRQPLRACYVRGCVWERGGGRGRKTNL